MPDLTAKRTLVKSPPELWEELSEVEGLAKHFGAFGEIKITKLEPEHTVAWEGEHGSGTVSIEPSGWGTKVTLHAELTEAAEPEAPEEAPAAEESEDAAEAEPNPQDPEPETPEAAEPGPVVVEEPVLIEEVSLPQPDEEPKRRGFWGWLFRSRTAATHTEPSHAAGAPEPEPPVTEPEPPVAEPEPPVAESEPAVTEPVAAVAEPEPVAAEPEPDVESGTAATEPVAAATTEPVQEPEEDEPELEVLEEEADPDGSPLDTKRARLVLDEALDALGAAHHRPFSRG